MGSRFVKNASDGRVYVWINGSLDYVSIQDFGLSELTVEVSGVP